MEIKLHKVVKKLKISKYEITAEGRAQKFEGYPNLNIKQ